MPYGISSNVSRYSKVVGRGISSAKSEAAYMGKSTASAFLTDKGRNTLTSNFDMSKFKLTPLGIGLEAVFAAYGTSARMKRGEALLPSLGKELIENSIYGLAPQAAIGFLGAAAVKAYPQFKDAAAQKRYFSENMNYLGGNYMDTKTDHASRSRAMEHIKRSRSTIAASIGGEARRNHR